MEFKVIQRKVAFFGYHWCNIRIEIYVNNVSRLDSFYRYYSNYRLKHSSVNMVPHAYKHFSLWNILAVFHNVCGRIYFVMIKVQHLFHIIIWLLLILKPCATSSAVSARKSIWVIGVLRVATAVHRWTDFPCSVLQKVMDSCDFGEACPILTCKCPVRK